MPTQKSEFHVIHPLDDVLEKKRTGEGLGHIKMSRGVRWSLIILRGYLILMLILTFYHVLQLAKV